MQNDHNLEVHTDHAGCPTFARVLGYLATLRLLLFFILSCVFYKIEDPGYTETPIFHFAVCLIQDRRPEGMIEWVVSNTAISRYFFLKHLPEGNVQSDHNVVGHTCRSYRSDRLPNNYQS